jgi:hypothetical protein
MGAVVLHPSVPDRDVAQIGRMFFREREGDGILEAAAYYLRIGVECGAALFRRGLDQRVELLARAAGLGPLAEILDREYDRAHALGNAAQSSCDAAGMRLAFAICIIV